MNAIREISVEQVMAWIETKHVELWSDWLVSDARQRERAARWFLDQMSALDRFVGVWEGDTYTREETL